MSVGALPVSMPVAAAALQSAQACMTCIVCLSPHPCVLEGMQRLAAAARTKLSDMTPEEVLGIAKAFHA